MVPRTFSALTLILALCACGRVLAAGNVSHSAGNVHARGKVPASADLDPDRGFSDKTPLDARGRPIEGAAQALGTTGEALLAAGSYPQGEDNINVLHYELRFNTIDFTAGTVDAVAVLTIEALEALPSELVVDFRGFTISQVLIDDTPTTFSRLGTGSAKLHVDLPSPVSMGQLVELTVEYGGAATLFDGLGLAFKSSSGGLFAVTMAEPNGAHVWFPCNDRPDDKATLDLYATVEDGRQVGANGALVSETLDAGMRTFHWQELHPLSTYLVVMNAGDFTRVDVGGAPVPLVGYFTSSGVTSGTAGLNLLPAMFTTFEDAFGQYPFDKYGHAEYPDFPYGGMEHQTLTTLHPGYLDSYWVIAHELGHQWWGDLVGPASWDDLWLNEGFATYSELIAYYGKDRDSIGPSLPHSANWGRALNDPDYSYLFEYGLVYARGAWTLHHLRSFLGEDAFWPALLYYRARHEGSSATSEDLKNDFEQSSGLDLDAFYDRYVYHGGAPAISLVYYADTRPGLGSRVIVRYTRTDGFTCPDVVFVRLGFSNGQNRIVRCVWNDVATYVTAYDGRTVTSVGINPLDDFPYGGTINSTGTLSDASTDGDTLPDGWELATLGTTSYVDTDDPDNDGADNAAEHEADTNPLDAGSAPGIRTFARTGDGPTEAIEITYDTSVFAYYTIETTATPENPLSWSAAGPKTRGTGAAAIWSDAIAGEQKGFVRLVVTKD